MDNCKVEIEWRDDAELFATSIPTANGRRVRIYSRDGNHLSTSEPDLELLGPISWRANVILSALTINLDSSLVITQIERNGLKHGNFGNSNLNRDVSQIVWNSIGTLLCVQYQSGQLDIWRNDNWHFYLQCSHQYSEKSFIWFDTNNNNDLWVLSNGNISLVSINLEVEKSESTVAVQNGDSIGWTKYREASYPPPMFGYEVPNKAHGPFCLKDDNNLIVLNEDSLSNFSINQETEEIEEKIIFSQEGLGKDINAISAKENSVLLFGAKSQVSVINRLENNIKTFEAEIEFDKVFLSHPTPVSENQFYAVSQKADEYEENYCLVKGSFANDELEMEIINEYSKRIKNLCLCQGEPVYMVGPQAYFGFEKIKLNEGENVLSLTAHETFIILTTTSHELVIFEVGHNGILGNAVRRGCERGSSLVIAYDTKVIMQMPRGNIEIVEPRALLLKSIGKMLDESNPDWLKVFQLSRRQRVNSNLLVDHNGFMSFPAAKFFNQIMAEPNKQNIAAFNVFLFELEGLDVTSEGGLYYDIYRRSLPESPAATRIQKIQTVCKRLNDAIKADTVILKKCFSIYLHAQETGFEKQAYKLIFLMLSRILCQAQF